MKFSQDIQKQPTNIISQWSFNMTSDEKFDWYDYYLLAESFETDDSAKLRTGINRFYYSSFLESRDYLIEKSNISR